MTKYQDRSPHHRLNGIDAAQDPDSFCDPVTTTTTASRCPPERRTARSGSSIRASARSRPARARASRGRSAGSTATRPRSRSARTTTLRHEGHAVRPDRRLDRRVSSGTTFEDLTWRRLHARRRQRVRQLHRRRRWHDGWWQLTSGLTGGADGTTYRAAHPFRRRRPGQHHRAQLVRHLGDGDRRYAARVRHRRHGGLRPPPRRPGLGVLPGPDRLGPCRQDDADRPVGSGRHGQPVGQPPDPAANRRRLHAGRVHLHGDPGTTASEASNCSAQDERWRRRPP